MRAEADERRGEAEAQRDIAQATLDFVQGMLQSPVHILDGPNVRVVDLLERAATEIS